MSNKIIKINRGDSFSFKLFIPTAENPTEGYRLTSNDAVYFALLYPNQRFEDAIVIKGYDLVDQNPDNCELFVNIIPNDTRCLTPGVYYYTVKLQRGGTLENLHDFDEPDEVRTIIERTKFIINE